MQVFIQTNIVQTKWKLGTNQLYKYLKSVEKISTSKIELQQV